MAVNGGAVRFIHIPRGSNPAARISKYVRSPTKRRLRARVPDCGAVPYGAAPTHPGAAAPPRAVPQDLSVNAHRANREARHGRKGGSRRGWRVRLPEKTWLPRLLKADDLLLLARARTVARAGPGDGVGLPSQAAPLPAPGASQRQPVELCHTPDQRLGVCALDWHPLGPAPPTLPTPTPTPTPAVLCALELSERWNVCGVTLRGTHTPLLARELGPPAGQDCHEERCPTTPMSNRGSPGRYAGGKGRVRVRGESPTPRSPTRRLAAAACDATGLWTQ